MSGELRTALELARQAGTVLIDKGFEQGRLEAELLLAAVLGIQRLELYLQHDRPVTAAELGRFRASVRRRLRSEPVQYILGEVQFRQVRLQVDRRVLIPRPETEHLVGVVLDAVRSRSGLSVLDLGTGSGAIALSLAAEAAPVFDRIVATDVSADALDVARSNADRLGLGDRIEFRVGHLFDAVAHDERFGVIVSNPPYVAESEADTLAPDVRDWEPPVALFGGTDGTDILRALTAGAPARLERGGLLALEAGPTQTEPIVQWLSSAGFSGFRVHPDLAGRDRIVMARQDGVVCEGGRRGPPGHRKANETNG